MFRFHLVKDKTIQWTWWRQAQVLESGKMTRKVGLGPGDVQIQSTDDDNNELCVKLKYLMENGVKTEGLRTDLEQADRLPNASGNSGLPLKPAALIWALSVEIGIHPHIRDGRDYVRVCGTNNSGNVLTRLKAVLDSYGLETKVKIGIKDFGINSVNMVTEEVEIAQLSSKQDMNQGVQLHYSETWDKASWDHTNSLERRAFSGVITISFVACRRTCGDLLDIFPMSEAKPYVVHKMLKEGLDSDAIIIACDGEKIKCHKTFLKGQSDVFEVMFKETSNSLESTTGIIKMEDMSSKSVQAFLAFLYLDDLDNAKEDAAVALDILKAAHKYNVSRLEKRITQVLLMKPNNWFNVEMAIQLFIFARKIPAGDVLKRRATAALKALWDSPLCIQLFKEDPEAALELSQYLVSGGPAPAGSSDEGSEAKPKKRKNDC